MGLEVGDIIYVWGTPVEFQGYDQDSGWPIVDFRDESHTLATIDPAVLAELEHLFAGVSRFRFQLDHTDWFGQDVLWLGPREPGPFRALTDRVYQAFPAFPPYEGQFDVVVPHLTIGHGHRLDDLRAAEHSVQVHLPIDAHATVVTLITQQTAGGRWIRTATFALR